MRIWSRILIFLLLSIAISCGASKPATPLETFKTYTKAIKAKDTATMKLLLSDATIKMHEDEAKAQGTTIDEIVKRETFLGDNQKTIEFRNEKIDGDKATLEVRNSYGSWETWPFIRESGVWKIDKQSFADQIIREMDESNRKLDERINIGQPPVEPQPGESPMSATPLY